MAEYELDADDARTLALAAFGELKRACDLFMEGGWRSNILPVSPYIVFGAAVMSLRRPICNECLLLDRLLGLKRVGAGLRHPDWPFVLTPFKWGFSHVRRVQRVYLCCRSGKICIRAFSFCELTRFVVDARSADEAAEAGCLYHAGYLSVGNHELLENYIHEVKCEPAIAGLWKIVAGSSVDTTSVANLLNSCDGNMESVKQVLPHCLLSFKPVAYVMVLV